MPTPANALESVFPGNSEMAKLMRATDWSQSALGAPASWPISLRVALGILLTSRFEMWLGWGPDVSFFYNDAYRPTLGIKHPNSLAQPTAKLWAEIWDDVEPRIRQVYDTGQATWDRALLLILERSGEPEETYHTFSYSPILGESGKTEGLLCAVTEDTLQVISERRMETLRNLSLRLAGATDARSVLSAAHEVIGTNAHDLPFTLAYLFNDGTPELAFTTGIAEDEFPAALCEIVSLDVRTPQDVQSLSATLPTGAWDRAAREVIAVPLVGQGAEANLGVILVALNPLRPFDEDYAGFLNLIAGQVAAGLAGADAYESERRRSRALSDALRMRQDAAEVLERANLRLATEIDKRTGERDRLRALFQNAPSFMCILSGPEHTFEFANHAYSELVGQRDLVGMTIREALPDVEGQGYFELLDEVYNTATPFVGREMAVTIYRDSRSLPEERFVNLVYQPIFDEKGAVTGIFAEGHDVTDQKRAEESLRQINDNLADLVTARTHERDMTWRVSEDLFIVCGFDYAIRNVNPAWSAALGYTQDELTRMSFYDIFHPDDLMSVRDQTKALSEGRTIKDLDWRLRSSDGKYLWYSWSCVPEGDQFYGAGRDVTSRKILEEQLRRSQKMEALGQLTGGVAHDFNNLLQVISGNLQLLNKDVAGNSRAESRVQNALAGVTRGSKLASQLLAFGRRQPLEPRVVNVGRFLKGMDDMLRRTLGEEIELETVVSGGLWNTMIDPNQIENAVLNLAINARDAMNGRGRLTVEASNAALDETYARANDAEPGQYVLIAVTDTGTGIPEDMLEKVFEPFFSTKPEGKGTGLGLSMVYGLVKQSNGHVKIYSELGHGTTVKIYLPRTQATEDILLDLRDAPVQGGTETVLVVEDDDEVRETTVVLLTDLGYRTLRARDAASALTVIESGVPIDLLFTDVVMPGPLRSPELARKAVERLPHLAVLFTSGYTENAIVHGGRLDAGVELLPKPYSRENLARKIRHVLVNQQQRNAAAQALNSEQADRPTSVTSVSLNILLVEDDPLIQLNTADMLESLGHVVLSAATGRQALGLIGRDIDLLMTDLGLPDMHGTDLVTAYREQRPNLPVLIASGDVAAARTIDNVSILLKPYSATDIAKALLALPSQSER